MRSGADGTRVTLADIANINDGFEEARIDQQFNGQTSIEIDVYRTGLQSVITVADEVKEYLETAQSTMPYGVTLGFGEIGRVLSERDWTH